MIGMCGLATDTQTLLEKINFRLALYKLNEERDMNPRTLSNLVSTMLYEKRFGPYLIEPIIAGLELETPFICSTDSLGAQTTPSDFVAVGTCKNVRPLDCVSPLLFACDVTESRWCL